MAINIVTQWDVKTTGSDSWGGGYGNINAAGVDYSQQNFPQVGIENVNITANTSSGNSNTLIFLTGYNVNSGDIGNCYQSLTGTNANTGIFQITAVSIPNSSWLLSPQAGVATLSTSAGAASALTGNMGGCLASLGRAGCFAAGGNIVHIQSGVYIMNNATANAASGACNLPLNVTPAFGEIIGYGNTHRDNGAKPFIQASNISTFTMLTASRVSNVIVDGASLTSSRGMLALAYNCKGIRCTNNAFFGQSHFCEASGCATVGAFGAAAYYCVSHNNATDGFLGGPCVKCISFNNTGNGFNNTGFTSFPWDTCIAVNNSGNAGFQTLLGTSTGQTVINCISWGNAGSGFRNSAVTAGNMFFNNAAGGNVGAAYAGNIVPTWISGNIVLTRNPFVNSPGNNFNLNNEPGGGAACRAMGIPSFWPSMSTQNFTDIGLQHADPRKIRHRLGNKN